MSDEKNGSRGTPFGDAQYIDPKRIKPQTKPIRPIDEKLSDAIGADIKENGQTDPIIVRRVCNDSSYDYETVRGGHRQDGCLKHDIPVLAYVIEANDPRALELQIKDNLMRSGMGAAATGLALRRSKKFFSGSKLNSGQMEGFAKFVSRQCGGTKQNVNEQIKEADDFYKKVKSEKPFLIIEALPKLNKRSVIKEFSGPNWTKEEILDELEAAASNPDYKFQSRKKWVNGAPPENGQEPDNQGGKESAAPEESIIIDGFAVEVPSAELTDAEKRQLERLQEVFESATDDVIDWFLYNNDLRKSPEWQRSNPAKTTPLSRTILSQRNNPQITGET